MGGDERNLAKRARAKTGPVEDYDDPDFDPDGPSPEDVERFSDVTVKCTGCGTELLDDVSECWKCGRAVGAAGAHESGLPTWAVLTTVVLILLFVAWVSGFLS